MDGLGPFKYIVDEAEESFFQETAEGIAKTAAADTAMMRFVKSRSTGKTIKQMAASASRRKAKLKVPKTKELTESQRKQILADAGARDKPSKAVRDAIASAKKGGYMGHGGLAKAAKLALLIRKSNELDLTKEASEQFLGEWATYEDILNVVAAASPNEDAGMTKTACEYADTIEAVIGQNDSLDKIADLLVHDSMWADAVNAGLTKEAIGGIRAFLSAAKATPGALWRGAKALGTPMKSVKALGLRGAAGRVGRAIESPVQKAYHARKAGILGKHKAKATSLIRGATDKAEALKRRIAASAANPTEQARLGMQLKGVEALKSSQTARKMKASRKLLKSQRESGADYIKPTVRQRAAAAASTKAKTTAKASASEGARKAEGAAAKATESAKAKDFGKAKKIPKAPPISDKVRVEAYKKYESAKAGRTLRDKDVSPPAGYQEWVGKGRPSGGVSPQPKGGRPKPPPTASAGVPKSAPATATAAGASPAAAAKTKGYVKQKAPSKAAPGAPSPQSPPRGAGPESVKDTPGFGEIHKKWSDGGWKALSDAEKRKVYVGAGVAFVGQRAVMDKPII